MAVSGYSRETSPSFSSRSVLESCVMPVLLYGTENWELTERLVKKMETFQGELVKRILKWPTCSLITVCHVVH